MSSPRSLCSASILTLLAAVTASACSGKDPYSPGTKLGTFHVSARLAHTSCGPTPDPWEFDVRFNHDGGTLYWIQTDAPPIEGRVDASATSRLESELTATVRPADAKAKREACVITRSDVLTVTLADASAQRTSDPSRLQSFTGTLVYAFAPTGGSDCSDQVTTAGGDFAALPCSVQYAVSGVFTSAPR